MGRAGRVKTWAAEAAPVNQKKRVPESVFPTFCAILRACNSVHSRRRESVGLQPCVRVLSAVCGSVDGSTSFRAVAARQRVSGFTVIKLCPLSECPALTSSITRVGPCLTAI